MKRNWVVPVKKASYSESPDGGRVRKEARNQTIHV